MSQNLFFDAVKEHRGSYLVEYRPPSSGARFATISLSFLGDPPADLAAIMTAEAERWLGRYPVPVMLTAWDASGDQLGRTSDDQGFLVAWVSADATTATSWSLDDLTREADAFRVPQDWRDIYRDVPVRTASEVKLEADAWVSRRRSQNRALRFALLFWVALLPAAWAVFQFFGPIWLGVLLLAISLSNAWHAAKGLWGLNKPGKTQLAAAEKKRKMEHYYYHCERNPAGFASLRAQNFAEDERARTQAEAEKLAKPSS